MCKVHDGEPELARLSRLRKSQIKGLLVPPARAPASSTVRPCGHACKLGLEGTVSKRLGCRIRPSVRKANDLKLLPRPACCERRHRGLARRLVAVRRRAVLVTSESERPHPRRCYGRGVRLEDATDNGILSEHVEIVILPFAG